MTRVATGPLTYLSRSFAGLLGLTLAGAGFGGCAGDAPEDPGASAEDELGAERTWDAGPTAEDESSDRVSDSTGAAALAAAPNVQLPFPCGQVWSGP